MNVLRSILPPSAHKTGHGGLGLAICCVQWPAFCAIDISEGLVETQIVCNKIRTTNSTAKWSCKRGLQWTTNGVVVGGEQAKRLYGPE